MKPRTQIAEFFAALVAATLLSGCAMRLSQDKNSYATFGPTGETLYDESAESTDPKNNNLKSCEGLSHGAVFTGYLHQFASPGESCVHATKTCLNGHWTGPQVFPSCTQLQ